MWVSTHTPMLFISTFSQDCLSLPTSSHSSKLFFQPWERLILPNMYSIANQWFLDDNSATCCVQLGWGLVKGLAYLEKDRGNPRVLKVYPYPHPFKTPTVKTLQGLKELNVSWVAVDARRFTVSMVQGFRGGHSSPSETEVERTTVDCKRGAKTRLRSNYSYCTILIVEES